MKLSFYSVLLLAGMTGIESVGGGVSARPQAAPVKEDAVRGAVMSLVVAQAPAVSLKESDSGKSISLKVGQMMEIRLPGNYTTGYSWHFLVPKDGVAIVSEDYKPFRGDMAGAPGEVVAILKATKAGTYPVVGYYYRTWEGLKPASDQSFVITVTVSR